jgi:hypothetical protein
MHDSHDIIRLDIVTILIGIFLEIGLPVSTILFLETDACRGDWPWIFAAFKEWGARNQDLKVKSIHQIWLPSHIHRSFTNLLSKLVFFYSYLINMKANHESINGGMWYKKCDQMLGVSIYNVSPKGTSILSPKSQLNIDRFSKLFHNCIKN